MYVMFLSSGVMAEGRYSVGPVRSSKSPSGALCKGTSLIADTNHSVPFKSWWPSYGPLEISEAVINVKTSINRLRITGHSDFVHRSVFQNLENTAFRKDLFPSLGKGETPTLLGPLEGANFNHD
jgi:hypothetical protein